MLSITYTLIDYEGTSRIAIKFPYNKDWNKRMDKVKGARWSKNLHCWHIPDTPKNRQKCGLAELKEEAIKTRISDQTPKTVTAGISRNNTQQLQKYLDQLKLKAYSPSTIKTYRTEFLQLLQKIETFPAQDLKADDIRRYLLLCINDGLKENSIHSRLNAIKFYYEQVLRKERFLFEIPRPKKPLLLPGIFSKEEIAAIINTIENLKQKTILMLTYACGLRVSEVVSLKIEDIDSGRMSIFIKRAKGKKDRIVSLSPTLLVMLRAYYRKFKPVKYLFENNTGDGHYSTRSIQIVLQSAKAKAGVIKPGGMHALRHSFATHLLDKGIDVVMIQKLLGHNDINTTLRYLHVTNKDLSKIISPLEDIKGIIK